MQLGKRIALTTCTDEAVAIDDLRAEPRHIRPLIDGVQPQGHLRQFDSDGIEVNAVYIAVSDVHLHFLYLLRALIVRNRHAGLLFLARQIRLSQLADGFIQEGCAAHRRLADGQMEDFIGGLPLKQLL